MSDTAENLASSFALQNQQFSMARHTAFQSFPIESVERHLRRRPDWLPFVLAFGLRFPATAAANESMLHLTQRCVAAAASASASSSSSVSHTARFHDWRRDPDTKQLLLLYRAISDPLERLCLSFHLTGVEPIDQLRLSLMPRALLRIGLQLEWNVPPNTVDKLLLRSNSDDTVVGSSTKHLSNTPREHWQRILEGILDAYAPVTSPLEKSADEQQYCQDVISNVIEPMLRRAAFSTVQDDIFSTDAIVSSFVKVVLRVAESFQEAQWFLARLMSLKSQPFFVDISSLIEVETATISSNLLWRNSTRAEGIVATALLEELPEFTRPLELGCLPAPAWFVSGCALTSTHFMDHNPPAVLLVSAAAAFSGRWTEALRYLARTGWRQRQVTEDNDGVDVAAGVAAAAGEHRAFHRQRAKLIMSTDQTTNNDLITDENSNNSSSSSSVRWECNPQLPLFAAAAIHNLSHGAVAFRSIWEHLVKRAFVVNRVPSSSESEVWLKNINRTSKHAAISGDSSYRLRWHSALRLFHNAWGGLNFPQIGYSFFLPSSTVLQALTDVPSSALLGQHASYLQSPLLWAYALAVCSLRRFTTSSDDGNKSKSNDADDLESASAAVVYRSYNDTARVIDGIRCLIFLARFYRNTYPQRKLLHPQLLVLALWTVVCRVNWKINIDEEEEEAPQQQQLLKQASSPQEIELQRTLAVEVRRLQWLLIKRSQRSKQNSDTADDEEPSKSTSRDGAAMSSWISTAGMNRIEAVRLVMPEQFACAVLLDLCGQRGVLVPSQLRKRLVRALMRHEEIAEEAEEEQEQEQKQESEAARAQQGNNKKKYRYTLACRELLRLSVKVIRSIGDISQKPDLALRVLAGARHWADEDCNNSDYGSWWVALKLMAVPNISAVLPKSVLFEAMLTSSAAREGEQQQQEQQHLLRIRRDNALGWLDALRLIHEHCDGDYSKLVPRSQQQQQQPARIHGGDEFLYRCVKLNAPLWLVLEALLHRFTSKVGRGYAVKILRGYHARWSELNTDEKKLYMRVHRLLKLLKQSEEKGKWGSGGG